MNDAKDFDRRGGGAPRIMVIGGAGVDYIARGERLPGPGESLTATESYVAPGGKGANSAVAAARLGARVSLLTLLGGDDHGAELISHLESESIETRWVGQVVDRPTAATLIQVDEKGRKQTLSRPGAVDGISPAMVQAACEAIADSDALVVNLEIPIAAVAEAIRLARMAKTTIVLDPAPAQRGIVDLLQHVDVVTPNSTEAEAMTGVAIDSRADASKAAGILRELGVATVAVPAGSAGKLIRSADGERLYPKIQVESIDTTGAGDAFVAAVATRVAFGDAWEEVGRYANAAAAIATTSLGAQTAPLSDALVRKLIARG